MGKGKIPGIVLAAGSSTRFQDAKSKLRQAFRGRTIIYATVQNALQSSLESVCVVCGYQYEGILDALLGLISDPRLQILFNPDWQEGRSTSVATGVRAIKSETEYVMFIPGDMPLITPFLIDSLLKETETHPSAPLYFPIYGEGKKGNPIIYHRRILPELLAITGDVTGYELVLKYFDEAVKYPLSSVETQLNINTIQDYQLLLAMEGKGR